MVCIVFTSLKHARVVNAFIYSIIVQTTRVSSKLLRKLDEKKIYRLNTLLALTGSYGTLLTIPLKSIQLDWYIKKISSYFQPYPPCFVKVVIYKYNNDNDIIFQCFLHLPKDTTLSRPCILS